MAPKRGPEGWLRRLVAKTGFEDWPWKLARKEGCAAPRAGLLAQVRLDAGDHGAKHLGRQAAGVGVVARAVVAIEQDHALAQRMLGPMPERESRLAGAHGIERAVMGDTAERQDGAEAGKADDPAGQVSAAGGNF